MKILYVSPYPPARDGIGNYTRALADAVRDQGHDVRVVVPRLLPDSPGEVMGAVSAGRGGLAALRDEVAAWNPDVVHVQFAVAAYGTRTARLLRLMAALRRALPAPIVITMHEVTRDTALLRAPGRALYRRVAGHGDQVIVHTGAAFDALTGPVGVPAPRATVIPHPAARPPAAGSEPGDLRARFGLGGARIMLAFGFVHVDKGLDDVVQALGILRRSQAVPLDSIRVVVAGAVRRRQGLFRVFEARDHVYQARVLRQARRRAVSQCLTFTGYVPDGDIAAWFQAAEGVLLPYRRTEQSGVAALATAFGRPVLASTAGGLGEQFAGSRWTFPPRRPDRLAQVLADFVSAPAGERGSAPRQPSLDIAAVAAATVDAYLTATQPAAQELHHAG